MTKLRLILLAVGLGTAGLAVPAHALAAGPTRSVAQSGALKLCKVAGAGVVAGDLFSFNLTMQTVTRTVTVPTGSCTTLLVGTRATALTQGFFANTPNSVGRLLGADVKLEVDSAQLSAAQVQTLLKATVGKPGGVVASSNALLTLAQQLLAADLNVLSGVVAPPSVLAAIAQANSGLEITFNGNAIRLTTPLSTPQLSSLTAVLTGFNEGRVGGPGAGTANVAIVEAPVLSAKVSAITCSPAAACTTVDLTGESGTAKVSTDATTEVRFTNESNLGNLKLCKVAGNGISAGTNFSFSVTVGSAAAQTVTVAAGDCAFVNGIADGTSVVVTETLASSFRVFSIACNPGCSNIDLTGATATIPIKRNTDSTLTFTNESTL